MEYGLIGEKLGHSFSKIIHEYFNDYTYDLTELDSQQFAEFMINKPFKGINVTIPYKQKVIEYLSFIDDKAKEIHAVNTIVNKDGKLYGYNTDYYGLKKMIERNQIEVEGSKVVILGSGGTSHTSQIVCKDLKAKKVVVVSRNGNDNYDNIYAKHADAEIIINTTPVGMYPNNDQCLLDLDKFDSLKGVVDVIYNPLETVLVAKARKKGIKSCNGLFMLVAQAIKASELFLDKQFDDSLYDEVYNYLLLKQANIVLIGMPTVGKTTIGTALAEKLNKPLVDSDVIIVEENDMEITQMFAQKGEQYFRDEESRVVKNICLNNNQVIASGGGSILRDENVDRFFSNGIVVFLDRNIEGLTARKDRPLSSSIESLKRIYQQRYTRYCSVCDVRVFLDGYDTEENVNKILEAIKTIKRFK